MQIINIFFFLRNRESLLTWWFHPWQITRWIIYHLFVKHIDIFVHCIQFQDGSVKFDHVKRNCWNVLRRCINVILRNTSIISSVKQQIPVHCRVLNRGCSATPFSRDNGQAFQLGIIIRWHWAGRECFIGQAGSVSQSGKIPPEELADFKLPMDLIDIISDGS